MEIFITQLNLKPRDMADGRKRGLGEDLIGIQQHYVGRNSFPERRDTYVIVS